MYYTQDQIDRANQADIAFFLQSQGEQLERAGAEYRWKRHDSLTIRENKWYRHSQSKGGGPVDFVMECFFGKSFPEAVALLIGDADYKPKPEAAQEFRLPPHNPDNRTARKYLTEVRRIDDDVTDFLLPPAICTRMPSTTMLCSSVETARVFPGMLTAKARPAASAPMFPLRQVNPVLLSG
jgi:hypothetical protein